MDPSSGLITDAIVEVMGDERGLRLFLEHEDDVLEFNWMARNRLSVGLLSEATGGKLDRALRYLCSVPPGSATNPAVHSPRAQNCGADCVLPERRGRPDFTARDPSQGLPAHWCGSQGSKPPAGTQDDRDNDDAEEYWSWTTGEQ